MQGLYSCCRRITNQNIQWVYAGRIPVSIDERISLSCFHFLNIWNPWIGAYGCACQSCSAMLRRRTQVQAASCRLSRHHKKIRLISWGSMSLVSDIKLIRTDTTLDLSQKAEKGMLLPSISLALVPRLRLPSVQSVWDQTPSSPPLVCNSLGMAISRMLRRLLCCHVESEHLLSYATSVTESAISTPKIQCWTKNIFLSLSLHLVWTTTWLKFVMLNISTGQPDPHGRDCRHSPKFG